jgi:hypothetical protein
VQRILNFDARSGRKLHGQVRVLLAGPALANPLQNQGFAELHHFGSQHAVAVVQVNPRYRRLARGKRILVKPAAFGRGEFRPGAVRQRDPVVAR